MPTANVNGIELFYELGGTGEVPLVLVHGSWDSHQTWGLVLPELADAFRVLTYDRRGHSRSEHPAGHIPHLTHPDAYIEATVDFIHEDPKR